MATYNNIEQRIDDLKKRTGKGSITPKETFEVMGDILDKTKAVDMTSQPLVVVKSYNSLALANADKNPVNPANNKPMVIGQIVSVTADGDNNGVYRLAALAADGSPNWELQSKLGDMKEYAKSGGSENTLKEVDDDIKKTLNMSGIVVVNHGAEFLHRYIGSDYNDPTIWGVGYLSENGSVINVSNYRYSISYNRIVKGDFHAYINYEGYARFLVYDSNKELITSIVGFYNKYISFNTPNNAYYYRFSQVITKDNKNISLKYIGNDNYVLYDNNVYSLLSDLERVESELAKRLNPKDVGIVDVPAMTDHLSNYAASNYDDDIWISGYLDSNGNIVPDSNYVTTRDYVKIAPDVSYRGVVYFGGKAKLLLYNSANQIVQVVSGKNHNILNFTSVNDAIKTRFSVDRSKIDTLTMCNLQLYKLATNSVFMLSADAIQHQDTSMRFELLDNLDSDRAILSCDCKIYDVNNEHSLTNYGQHSVVYNVKSSNNTGMYRAKFDVAFGKLDESKTVMNIVSSGRSVILSVVRDSVSQPANDANSYYSVIKVAHKIEVQVGGVVHDYKVCNNIYNKGIVGNNAFWIRFKGDVMNQNNQDIAISYDGVMFKIYHLNGDSVIDSFDTVGKKVAQLYSHINSLDMFEAGFSDLNDQDCSELIQFSDVRLVTDNVVDYQGNTQWDAGRLYVPYEIDASYHTVEVMCDGTNSYLSFDGFTFKEISGLMLKGDTSLSIGYINGYNKLRDLHVNFFTCGDAEVIKYNTVDPINGHKKTKLISSYNPCLLVYEGHGIDYCTEAEAPLSNDMAAPITRLDYLFSILRNRGYVSVNMHDIISWKLTGGVLPKRCYTVVMDDWRLPNYTDVRFRKIFDKYNVKCNLCLITSVPKDDDIVEVRRLVNQMKSKMWYPHSHTHDHRHQRYDLPSSLPDKYNIDAAGCDKIDAYSNVLTHPYGETNSNTLVALKDSTFVVGFGVVNGNLPCRLDSDYNLGRVELGIRESLDRLLANIY